MHPTVPNFINSSRKAISQVTEVDCYGRARTAHLL